MHRNCFIDEKGRIYKTESLIEASKDLPVEDYEINSEIILEQLPHWQLNTFRDYLAHYKRVSDADLLRPLILRSDAYVMDGWHRIIKALYQDLKILPAKKFITDPEPDE